MIQRRLLLISLAAAYFCLLCYSYAVVESDVFGWMGFYYAPPPWPYMLLSLLLSVAPACWLPVRLDRPSQTCTWILYLTVLVPATIVPYHVVNREPQEIVVLPVALFSMFALLCLLASRRPFQINTAGVDPRVVFTGLLGMALVLVPMVLVTSGSFSLNLSLADIYDRRLDARDLVSPRSMLAYGIQLLSYSVAPILLVIGYLRRHWLALGLGLVGLLSVFSLRATKSELFMPVFLLALTVLVTRFRHKFGLAMLSCSTALVALSIISYQSLNREALSDYGVRRMIMVPAQLTGYYWDYFSDRPHVFYSDGFLRSVLRPAYNEPTARLIGAVYMGSPDAHANANLWAAGFAQMGYLGMFVTTCALAMLLRCIDGLVRHGHFALVASMTALFAIGWTNGALETSMLTGGVAGSLLVLQFLRSPTGNLGFIQVRPAGVRRSARRIDSHHNRPLQPASCPAPATRTVSLRQSA